MHVRVCVFCRKGVCIQLQAACQYNAKTSRNIALLALGNGEEEEEEEVKGSTCAVMHHIARFIPFAIRVVKFFVYIRIYPVF